MWSYLRSTYSNTALRAHKKGTVSKYLDGTLDFINVRPRKHEFIVPFLTELRKKKPHHQYSSDSEDAATEDMQPQASSELPVYQPRTFKGRSFHWNEDEQRLINAVKKRPFIYTSRPSRCVLNEIWAVVGEECGKPAAICRNQWRIMKAKREMHKKRKLTGTSQSKYIDGSLDFLDIRSQPEIKPECVSISSDEETTHFTTNPGCSENAVLTVFHTEASTIIADIQAPTLQVTDHSKQSNDSSSKTVLTQDIIQFLLKSRQEDPPAKEADLFESIASIMPTAPTKPSLKDLPLVPNIQVPAGLIEPPMTEVEQAPSSDSEDMEMAMDSEDSSSPTSSNHELDENEGIEYNREDTPRANSKSPTLVVKQEFDIEPEDENESGSFVVTFQSHE